jgi:hypothetical protein
MVLPEGQGVNPEWHPKVDRCSESFFSVCRHERPLNFPPEWGVKRTHVELGAPIHRPQAVTYRVATAHRAPGALP